MALSLFSHVSQRNIGSLPDVWHRHRSLHALGVPMRLFLVPAAAACPCSDPPPARLQKIHSRGTPLEGMPPGPPSPPGSRAPDSFANRALLAISHQVQPRGRLAGRSLPVRHRDRLNPPSRRISTQRREEEAYTEKLVAAQKVEKDQRVATGSPDHDRSRSTSSFTASRTSA